MELEDYAPVEDQGSEDEEDEEEQTPPEEILENEINELIKDYAALQSELRVLQAENGLYLTYLNEYNAECLENLDKMDVRARDIAKSKSASHSSIQTEALTGSLAESYAIPIDFKCDMVFKKTDIIKARIVTLESMHQKKIFGLVAEIEELTVREEELVESIETFQALIANHKEFGLPIEKYINFVISTSKRTKNIIDKLRLRTASLKVEYGKIQSLYVQKKVVGENLQRVDFDQLEIENSHLKIQIDQNNRLYMSLKKMSCRGNLKVTQSKEKLEAKIEQKDKLKAILKSKEEFVQTAEDNLDKAYTELNESHQEYLNFYNKINGLIAPPVPDYVRAKFKLNILKKDMRVLQRRLKLQTFQTTTNLNQLKKITGLRCINLNLI